MRILFVTSECAPWCKTGGLADVSAGLPAALRALGLDARLMMPAYAPMAEALRASEATAWPAFAKLPPARVREARLPNGVPAMLVDCPELYARAGGPYQDPNGADWDDNALRFAQLARIAAALGAPNASGWQADVIHCNDWQAALALAYLRYTRRAGAAGVVTIHNLAFQGLFAPEVLSQVGLPRESFGIDGLEFHGRVSFLKAGLSYADVITTVSPSYAKEIQGAAGGMGLQGLLRYRRAVLQGIVNGIDEDAWNPRTDAHIDTRYGPDTVEGKAMNRGALRREFGLPDVGAPLAGMICRLTEQKGVDLVLAAAPALLQGGGQLVVLGTGDATLERALRELAFAHPRQVAVALEYDEALAHRIEAGADVFLMPSRFEPCGMNQMYSQRYGTIPVVRATGGLIDTVVDAAKAGGSGFVFQAAEPEALREALARMRAAWKEPARWRALQRNGMARDFSWRASAKAYRAAYELALRSRAARERAFRAISAVPARTDA